MNDSDEHLRSSKCRAVLIYKIHIYDRNEKQMSFVIYPYEREIYINKLSYSSGKNKRRKVTKLKRMVIFAPILSASI